MMPGQTKIFDDESFDLMSADYNNPSFNSYTEGKGKDLGNPNELSEVTLRITNIPQGLEKQGLFNLFSKYGEVEVKYQRHSIREPGTQIAYIKYDTQISANRAIKEVHKEPPFHMRVQFAPPQTNKTQAGDIHNDSSILEAMKPVEPQTEQKKPDNIYIGPRLEEIQASFFPPENTHDFIIPDNFDPLYCNPFVGFHENKYKIYPILDVKSAEFMNTPSKKVSLGHCFYTEEKEERKSPNKPKSLSTDKKVKSSEFDRCVLCPHKIAAYSCSTECSTFYCSLACRTKDWPNHQLICGKSVVSNDACDNSTRRSLKVTHVEDNFIYAIKSEDVKRFESMKKRLQEECPNQPSCRIVAGGICAILCPDQGEWCRGKILKASSPISTIHLIDYGFSKQCMATFIKLLPSDLSEDEPFALKIKLQAPSNSVFIPGSFLEVNSLKQEDDAYIAEFIENSDKKSSISTSVSKTSDFVREINVKIIDLSAGRCPGDFTEVTVIGKLSSCTYYVSWRDLTSLNEFPSVSAYIKIIWKDRKMVLPIGAKKKVRSLRRISSDFFYVEPSIIEDQSEMNTNRASVIEWLEEGNKGKILVTSFKRDNLFLAAIVLDDECKVLDQLKLIHKIVFSKLNKKMKNPLETDDFVPLIGDLVGVYVEHESIWTRGIIWSISPNFVRCSLIDLGCVVSVHPKLVRPLEKKCESYPFFGVSCEVKKIDSEKKLELFQKSVNTKYDFTVLKEGPDAVVCSLSDKDQEICTIEMKEWEPTSEEIGLKAVALKNKSLVHITQFYSSSFLHVTPVSQANFVIDQKLMKLIQSSQPLKNPPRFGQLVACRWSKDNCYHRAQVFEPFKDSVYRIFFVDFGTQELSSLENIYELDDELLSYPCLAVKVSLKGVEDADIPNCEAVNYLNSLGFKEEPLKIVFEDNDLSNAEFYDSYDESINEKMKQHLKVEDLAENEIIYDAHINFGKLEIGSEVELALLGKLAGIYFMFKPNTDVAQYVFGTHQKLINDYCEGLKSNGYTPYKGEVVFVNINTREMPERCWCRAIVGKMREYGSFEVILLDFGGQGDILVSSMRRMHPKFVTVPAVAVVVRPKIPQDLAQGQREKIDLLFSPLKTYSGKVLKEDDIEYLVDMKFLNDILRQL
ncbi:unnamed protein product [Bemisia tabaci]|uniref:Tudor domain-containing protein 1 n=1 Tax=Bemisia tabaci TaxID=7038 RepID=A0A9P0A9R4_BEMTA|nr:unnamed protein product [Bemisia tabaci]